MLIVRPGLSRLADFDLGGRPLAAAYDMIFLMDNKGDDALVRQFKRSRLGLGLALDTPYFNAGLMAIDRAAWRAEKLTERVTTALAETPQRFPFMEQDALNATLKGGFAPLSPRYNFMGDFFLLALERKIAPIVLHFVNAPKPWELNGVEGRGALRGRLPRLVQDLPVAGLGARAGRPALATRAAAPDAAAKGLRRPAVRFSGPDGVRRQRNRSTRELT